MGKKQASLDVSGKKMRQWTEMALDHIVPYFENMEKIPMKDFSGYSKISQKIREPLPKKGEPLKKLLSLIFDDLLVKGLQVPSPGYLAYIPVGSLFHSVLAEFITFSINRWPGIYRYAPGFVEIENIVIKWLCEMMGLPKNSGGVLTTGGSMANFGAIVTARHTHLGEDISKGVIYFSKEAHHSVEKSARLAGIPRKHLREVEVDSLFRISISDLHAKISADRKRGLKPFLVVGNAGSTGTGAVDDLRALRAICHREKLWFHVDAAWAGTLRLTKRGKKLLKYTELADSLTIDPHKALYTPFGCGALLVRKPKFLRDAHSFEAAYLPGENEEETLISPSKLSPELSRGVRGLQVWLPLKMLGIGPFIETLEEKWQLTDWITKELRKIKQVKIVFEPQTTIVGFRYDGKGTRKQINQMTRQILDRINSHGKVLLSEIEIDGYLTIRIVPFGQRTHMKQVKLVRDYVREAIRSERGKTKKQK